MASISDVAKRANVSVTTVSRIMNGERYVSPAAAKAVEKAIKDLDYVVRAVRPGPVPQRPRGVKSGMIVFLSVGPYTSAQMHRLAVVPALLGGIHSGAERYRAELLIAHVSSGGGVPSVLERRRVDGVLLFGFGNGILSASLKKVLNKVPTICCFRNNLDPQGMFDHVVYDNSHVGQMAAKYLLDRGHQNVAFASTNSAQPAFVERRQSFCNIIRTQGGTVTSIEGTPAADLTIIAHEAEKVAEQLIGLTPRPTGVFVSSDNLLLAVFNRLRQEGIEPGRDIELLGCNNDPQFMGQMHPRPATIDIKLRVIGERAVEQLFWRIAHPEDDSRVQLLVNPIIAPAETEVSAVTEVEAIPDPCGFLEGTQVCI